ncbi:MAG: hypothetical protein ACREFN_17335 [Acetobacteraceae bacterium]
MKVVALKARRPVSASPEQPPREHDLIPPAEDIGGAAWSPIATPSTLALITWRCTREASFPLPDGFSGGGEGTG